MYIYSEVLFSPETTVTVNDGGSLIIDSGVLINAKIIVHSGGSLVVSNNGRLILNSEDDLTIESGATADFNASSIQISFTN